MNTFAHIVANDRGGAYIDWQLSVKSDFARDICEIAYKFGEPAPGAPGTLP